MSFFFLSSAQKFYSVVKIKYEVAPFWCEVTSLGGRAFTYRRRFVSHDSFAKTIATACVYVERAWRTKCFTLDVHARAGARKQLNFSTSCRADTIDDFLDHTPARRLRAERDRRVRVVSRETRRTYRNKLTRRVYAFRRINNDLIRGFIPRCRRLLARNFANNPLDYFLVDRYCDNNEIE